ncbi:MAG: hypothetical protein ACUVTB_07115 [Candidatus Bathycorpusculaceae bacterium]
MKIEEFMKTLVDFVFVLDKRFDEDGLKFFRKLDPTKVKELRILMGS